MPKAKRTAPILAVLAVSLLVGCGKTITLRQYPEFWDETVDIDSVAVAEFRNAAGRWGAGEAVSQRLAELLIRNGTYRVRTPYELGAVEDARDYTYRHGDPEAAYKIGRNIGDADAVIVGEVTVFDVETAKEIRYEQEPIYEVNRRGERVIVGYTDVEYDHLRHDALVSANASLVDVRGGRVIHSAVGEGRAFSEGSPPELHRDEVLARAVDEAAAALVEQFAVTIVEVRIDNSALRVTDGAADRDEFTLADQTALAVVTLPTEAHRNDFRLVLSGSGGRGLIDQWEFTWDRADSWRGRSFEMDLSELLQHAGPGEFSVTLHSGRQEVLSKSFTVSRVEPR